MSDRGLTPRNTGGRRPLLLPCPVGVSLPSMGGSARMSCRPGGRPGRHPASSSQGQSTLSFPLRGSLGLPPPGNGPGPCASCLLGRAARSGCLETDLLPLSSSAWAPEEVAVVYGSELTQVRAEREARSWGALSRTWSVRGGCCVSLRPATVCCQGPCTFNGDVFILGRPLWRQPPLPVCCW